MADVKLKNGYVRIANTLLDQLFLREFTLKQIRVILLIIRLSYGYNKKYAIIKPKSRFDLANIHKQDINKTLKSLINKKVLLNVDVDSYSINKDFDVWEIPYNKFYNEKNFIDVQALQFTREILTNKVSETLTLECAKNLPKNIKSKQNTYLEVSETLTKNEKKYANHLLAQGKNPDNESNSTLTKDIIKDNIKTYIKHTYIGGENKKSKSKIDPYFNNPIADYFKSEYKRISKKDDCYLDNSKLNKLLEISADYPTFKERLPEILEKFFKITFPSGNKPSTKWLIIDGNWSGILNGDYDQYITDTTQEKENEINGWTL